MSMKRKINRASKERQFWEKIMKTHDVKFTPITEDIFGDGIPRMITVITKKGN